MPRLIITNHSDGNVGLGQFVGTVPRGTVRVRDLSLYQLQLALPQLVSLESSGTISWTTEGIPGEADDEGEAVIARPGLLGDTLTWDGSEYRPLGANTINGALKAIGPHVQSTPMTAQIADFVLGTGITFLRVNCTVANSQFTGITGGVDGRYLYIKNVGTAQFLVGPAESASSLATNRIEVSGGPGQVRVLRAFASAFFVYDGLSLRWTMILP